MPNKKIYTFYILSFMFTFHIALAAYVNSSFMTQNIPSQYVGLLYTVASIITLIVFAKSSSLLRYIGNKKFILSILIINIVSLTSMILINNPYVIASAFIGFIATNSLFMFSMDIFIEHFIDRSKQISTHGIYLSVINMAWVISPLLTSVIVGSNNNYKLLYKIGLVFVALTTIGILLSIRHFTDAVYKKVSLLKSFVYIKQTGHIRAIMIINFLLQFFFSIMVVYTPIYLRLYMHFTWDQIGIIFTIMLVPFVIFGALIGNIVEKYSARKRKLFHIGFFIMITSVCLIPHLGSNIALWALVLFLTRTGASIVQATAEIYFFTHVHEEDTHLLGIYRDMDPLAYIIGPIFATLVILVFPFVTVFFGLTLVLLVGFYFIPQLKHNHEYTLPTTNQ